MVTTCFSEWVPSKNRSFFITFGMAFMICGWLLAFAGVIGGALSNATAAATINEAMVSGGESAWRAALDSAIASAGVGLPFIGAGVDFDSWRYGYFIGAIPIVYGIVLWFAMPETPHWYASKGRFQDVNAALGKLEKSKFGNTDLSTQFAAEQYIVPKPVQGSGVAALFSKKYIKGTMTIWIAYFMGTFIVMGMNAWLPKMMVIAGYSYGLATLNNGAAVIADVLAGLGAEKFGRKKNIIGGFAFAVVMIVVTTIVFYVAVTAGSVPYGVIALVMVLFGFAINYGQTGTQPLMPEVYPASIRATGVSYCQAFGRFGGAFGPAAVGCHHGLHGLHWRQHRHVDVRHVHGHDRSCHHCVHFHGRADQGRLQGRHRRNHRIGGLYPSPQASCSIGVSRVVSSRKEVSHVLQTFNHHRPRSWCRGAGRSCRPRRSWRTGGPRRTWRSRRP